MVEMLASVDVAIIGGGVAGLSTALRLADRGRKVAVIERAQLGSGSTGRAAGLLGQLRSSAAATRMLMDGLQWVRELERRTGIEIFVQTGSLRIAADPDRAKEIRDLAAMGRAIGFPLESLSAKQVAQLLPYMRCDDLIEACYCPTDGHLQPAELAAAYAKAGRDIGVQYFTQTKVDRILVESGRVSGLSTLNGTIAAPVVVNATGPWSYGVAETARQTLQTAALGHYYLTTRPDPAQPVDRHSPAVRDRQNRIYTRPESGGLIVGIYEEEPVEYDMERLGDDFDMSRMKAARDDINVAMLIHQAQQRFPWINERTPMAITTGIMTFTPNGKPLCGKLPDVEGLYHCAGFSGHGIVQSPIIGLIMAELILDGQTQYDIAEFEADRYFDLPGFQSRADIKARCRDMYSGYYGQIETVRA